MKPFNGSALLNRDHVIVGRMLNVVPSIVKLIQPTRNTGTTSATRRLDSAEADVGQGGKLPLN